MLQAFEPSEHFHLLLHSFMWGVGAVRMPVRAAGGEDR